MWPWVTYASRATLRSQRGERHLARHMKEWQTEETFVYTNPISCIAHWINEMIGPNQV